MNSKGDSSQVHDPGENAQALHMTSKISDSNQVDDEANNSGTTTNSTTNSSEARSNAPHGGFGAYRNTTLEREQHGASPEDDDDDGDEDAQAAHNSGTTGTTHTSHVDASPSEHHLHNSKGTTKARWRRSNDPYWWYGPHMRYLERTHHGVSLRCGLEGFSPEALLPKECPPDKQFVTFRLLDVPLCATRANMSRLLAHMFDLSGGDYVFALRRDRAVAPRGDEEPRKRVWYVDVSVAAMHTLLHLSNKVWLSNTCDAAYMPMPSQITCTLKYTFDDIAGARFGTVAMEIKPNTNVAKRSAQQGSQSITTTLNPKNTAQPPQQETTFRKKEPACQNNFVATKATVATKASTQL